MKSLKYKSCFFIVIIILSFIDLRNKKDFYHDYKGEGVKVAVLDSGICKHKDFKNKKIKSYNFIDDSDFTRISSPTAIDELEHGTEVSGIIFGIVPNVELYALRILNESGEGDIKTLNKALIWCIENDIDIINLSFSTRIDNKELKKYINLALEKKIIVVTSYDNRNVTSFPAEYKDVIGVKANRIKDIYIDDGIVFAPGNNLKTTSNTGNYNYVTGNSYATAYITGVTCKLIGAYKNKDIIIDYNKIIKIFREKRGVKYV